MRIVFHRDSGDCDPWEACGLLSRVRQENGAEGEMRRWEMIGAIVGDIAGSRFEFHNRKTKEFSLLVSRG